MTAAGPLLAAAPPEIRFRGRVWPAPELASLAARWWSHLRERLSPEPPLAAMLMTNQPESVALFFALSAFASPLALLPHDPRMWQTVPPVPPGTPLVLRPGQGELGAAAAAAGYRPIELPSETNGGAGPPCPFLRLPGVVMFTSGSTGLPKPVYRSTAAIAGHAGAAIGVLGLQRGDAVLGALPLNVNHGLANALFTASLLDGPLGLVERFDHRSVLALFRTGEYRFFPCTPLMADLLGRCALAGPTPPAPADVKVSGGVLPRAVFDAFRRRYGVPLRPAYGSTEAGIISADWSPPDEIRPDSVGRAVPGVAIRIGDDPEAPLPPGATGRVWLRTPFALEGYGYPPRIEPREEHRGWMPTSDLGVLDAEGYLSLQGRADDCFKTSGGHLVNPADVARAVLDHPGVRDVAVVPIEEDGRALIGLLVESDVELTAAAVLGHAGPRLPTWSQPYRVAMVRALPRSAAGKIDRRACAALLAARPR